MIFIAEWDMELNEFKRLFTRLKSYYFSLYEVQQEIELISKSRKITITSNEHDYIESLIMRKRELKSKIKEILDESRN